MHLLFLVPLLSALVAVYIAQKSDEDIAMLMGTVSIVSLLVSLVMAPWEFQVIILLIGVIAARLLWLKTRAELEIIEEISSVATAKTPKKETKRDRADTTNLRIYRGVNYPQSQPLVPSENEEINGKYRVSPLKIPSFGQIMPSEKKPLKYRGVSITSAPASEMIEQKTDN